MGITLSLRIIPDRINADEWTRFYEDSLRFLRAYPGGIADFREVMVGRFTRRQYSRDIEMHVDDPVRRCWRVEGTLEDLKFGETFELRADLGTYAYGEGAGEISILDEFPEGWAPGVAVVFDAKTQGRAYHHALLAVGILAEWRFPGNALVWGDMDTAQARFAVEKLEEILGETGPLPLLADANRLYAEICRTHEGVAAVERFWDIYCGRQGEEMIDLARIVDRKLLATWQKQTLKECTPKTLGVVYQCINWLNATADVAALARMACLDADGPCFDIMDFVDSLARTGVALEPGIEEQMGILRLPSGTAHTVMTQFGFAYLEMSGLVAHRTRCFLGEAAVLEALDQVFPGRREELAPILREKTADVEKSVAALADAFTTKQEQLEEDPETGDLESFLYFSPDTPLSPTQNLALDGLAGVAPKMIADLESTLAGAKKPAGATLPALLLAACDQQRIVLPEDAWTAIDAEQDEWHLHLLLCLVGMKDLLPQELANLRTALLIHRDLRVLLQEKCAAAGV
ncbi:hypothetical protein [Desulfonatronum thioautotrophicum]|uniref:hypothetical protein n=1 Tax=Desulfonatronum thioautotrophicum TaxID=617001 RepID=UPI0005EBE57B|nr:hypothetical protein [Desulfonatronum thioautotrophicum]